jgi:hypothetical protein
MEGNKTMIIPAHRYVLQMVVYTWIAAWIRLICFALLALAGAAAGVALSVFGSIAFAGALEWVLCKLFPTGICG